MGNHLRWLPFGAALGVLALGGCSGEAVPKASASSDVDWSGYSQLVTDTVGDARADGASEEQLATLERVADAGVIAYSDLEERLQATFSCFDASGIPYTYEPPADGIDFPEGMYFHGDAEGMSEDQSLAVADECIRRESFYVDMVYQLSPGVGARRAREEQANLPAAIECVKRLGIDVGDSDTVSELTAVVDESGNDEASECLVPPEQMVSWD
ncbi:hypothetical protein [Demequina sp.]|uniref:hypothetical protein n=1 Tax=Demequina sp. TaxID=2050685 RepID=UPI003D0A99CD